MPCLIEVWDGLASHGGRCFGALAVAGFAPIRNQRWEVRWHRPARGHLPAGGISDIREAHATESRDCR
jgi:hypothetical protein